MAEKKKGKKQLKVVAAALRRPTPAPQAEAARAVQERLTLAVEVENPTDKPLQVWTSRRAYDYDSSSHVLTLYLTDQTPGPPPGIRMISDHPRTPVQVEVKANSKATLDLPVPAVIRRRVPGEGLGMSFVEEKIDRIDRVDLHIQSAPEAVQTIAKESPDEHRKRLRAHGDVVRASVTPTQMKER